MIFVPSLARSLITSEINPLPTGSVPAIGSSSRIKSGRRATARANSTRTNGRTKANRPPFWLDPWPRVRFLSAERARARRQKLERRLDRAQRLVERLQALPGASPAPLTEALQNWARSLRTLGLQIKFREQTLDQYLPFILENRYIFEAHNIREAYAAIRPEDRRLLPWDPEQIDWRQYWRHSQIEGIKKWVQPEAVREWTFRI